METNHGVAKARYGVFLIGNHWRLCCNEHRLGRYDDQRSAVAAGKRAASEAIGSGLDAELFIMDLSGELRKADLALFGH